jgi:hypothetical protein
MSIFAVIDNETDICNNVVVWNDDEHPWVPDDNHYIINIDGLSVGINWSYDKNTNTWAAPAPSEPVVPPAPTLGELQAQLAVLTAQMAALANTG